MPEVGKKEGRFLPLQDESTLCIVDNSTFLAGYYQIYSLPEAV
jgi:hypothetical protein